MEIKTIESISRTDIAPVARLYWDQVNNVNFKVGNLVTALTCFCALSPRLKFNYFYDGPSAPHYLLTQVVVIGQSTDGKSFSHRVFKQLMDPVLVLDKKEEEAELAYAELKRTKGQSKDKPNEPVTVKRCLIKFTRNKIVKRAHMMIRKYGEPLSFMVFTDELSTLVERRGSYGDLRDIAKLAYNGEEVSTDTNCDQSYNATVPIRWCSIYNSTPAILYRYIDKDACESGNANRLIPVLLGDLLAESVPTFREFTDSENALIHEWQQRLMDATYDSNGNLCEEHLIPMEWMYRDEKIWCDAQRKIIGKTLSNAHNSFYKRASTSAARLAAMMYYLWDENPKCRPKVRRLYYALADYILRNQLKLFGKMYEKAMVKVEDYSEGFGDSDIPLYDQMPKRWTRDQLRVKVEELELGTAARQFIYKWKKSKLIYEVEEGSDIYEKLY